MGKTYPEKGKQKEDILLKISQNILFRFSNWRGRPDLNRQPSL